MSHEPLYAKYFNPYTLIFKSLIVFFAIAWIGEIAGHHIKLLAASLSYFFFTFYYLNKTSKIAEERLVLAVFTLPLLLIYVPLHLINYEAGLLSIPSTGAHFIAIIFSYLTYKIKNASRYVFPVILILISMWATFNGYSLWLHKLNFGTFNGKVSYHFPAPVEGKQDNGTEISFNDLRGKVILLDFWNSRCGVCFQKFPQLQNLYDSYKANPSFRLLAVNKPLESDTSNQAFEMLRKRNYRFPSIIPFDKNLAEAYGVKFYPTTFIIDQSGMVVYKGNVENAGKVLGALLGK